MKIIKTMAMATLIIMMYHSYTIAQISTDNEFLLKFAERKTIEDGKRQERVKNFIGKNRLQKQITTQDGISGELFDVIDEQPVYEIPLGMEQVETVRANKLWPEYDLGLNISGAGYNKIGLWLGNKYTIYDHTEFTGRMSIEDEGGDIYTNHDTVVSGIIMGEGINANAKGIAYKCSLKVYRSDDMLSEIALATVDGMEISTYSWATSTCYSSFEASIDTIAYKAPYYLYCQSGGNTYTRLYGQGKNSLAVGSVYSLSTPYAGPEDVVIANSQHGPAVDGRIKPDIMAPGGGFTATQSVDAYGYLSSGGTSYSAPVAAGAGVLLQQHYQNTHSNNPMFSSDLKGLLIHTADEAGSADGPDYYFGWGLINARRAADLITLDSYNNNFIIDHPTLNNGSTFERVVYSDGTKPIKVTICWTDPPSYRSDCNDLTPRLINDLDLKIIKDGVSFYPWTLDPSNINSPAMNNTKNYLDNIEQIYISEPSAGTYTIQVSHDGNLSNDGYFTDGTQSFTIIDSQEKQVEISDSPPEIEIFISTDCNSGEIIYNSETETFNFCKDGIWTEMNFSK